MNLVVVDLIATALKQFDGNMHMLTAVLLRDLAFSYFLPPKNNPYVLVVQFNG